MARNGWLLTACFLVGCAAAGDRADAPRPPAWASVEPFAVANPDVVLLVTSGTYGRLEACDCPGPMLGGLARRSGLVRSYRRAFPNVLAIDAGNAFWIFPDDPRNRYLLRGYETIGYEALIPGAGEWAALPGTLTRLMRAHRRLTYLSSNAADRSARLPIRRVLVRRAGEGELAVLSYVSSGSLQFLPPAARAELVLSSLKDLSRHVAEQANAGRAVIVVAHVAESELPALAGIDGVDLIIRGHTHSLSRPVRVGSVPVVQVGGPEQVGAVALKVRRGRIAALDYRLEAVDERWPVDERLVRLFHEYLAKIAPD